MSTPFSRRNVRRRPGLLDRSSPGTRGLALAVVAALSLWVPAASVHAQSAEGGVSAVVDAFHRALAEGDSVAALDLLAEDAVILEGGGVETKDEYRSGHLSGDMRYAAAVPAERGPMDVRSSGDVAWAWSTNVRQGRMGDREIDSRGAELVVLRREDGRWRITAIHWSSRSW